MPRGTAKSTKYPRVYKRETNKGRVYDFYVIAEGKQVWTRGKHTNLEEANRDRDARQKQADLGYLPSAKPRTLGQFVTEDWLPHQQARVKQGTLDGDSLDQYTHDLHRHLLPALGAEQVERLSLERLQRFQDVLSARYANHTVLRVVNTLSGILEMARKYRLILVNPAHDLDKPAATAEHTPIELTVEQLYALADLAPSGDERRLVLVTAFTGLRSAEVFGLRWQNVNTEEGCETILVREQFYRGKQKLRAKTRSGNRLHTLEPNSAALLREQWVEGRHSPAGYVFPAPEGGAWHASNFNRRIWQRMRTAAGHPDLWLHDLRHFYVTFVRQFSGLPSSVSQQLTGHADDKIHDHYTKPIPGSDTLYREAMRPVFRRPETTE